MRRRNTSPTAIGSVPLFFLDKASSGVPQSALKLSLGRYQGLQTSLLLSEQTQTDQVQFSLLRAEDVLETA